MGLDIYLRYCENWDEHKRKQELYEEKSNEFWGVIKDRKYEEIPKPELEEIRKKCEDYAIGLGLNPSGDDHLVTDIEDPSKKYPNHYFKVGYFRSSYNDSGINTVLRNFLGENSDLYYIFNVGKEHEYMILPDWGLALFRVKQIKKKFKNKLKETGGIYCFSLLSASTVPNHVPVSSKKEAIEKFLSLKPKKPDPFGDSFSNIDGFFSLTKPIEVYAIIQGKSQYDVFGEQEVYIVAKDKTYLKFYKQALEIIEETILYVLSEPDKQNYRLAWSS